MFEFLGSIQRRFNHLGRRNQIQPEISNRQNLRDKFDLVNELERELETTSFNILMDERLINRWDTFNNEKDFHHIEKRYRMKDKLTKEINSFKQELRYENLDDEYITFKKKEKPLRLGYPKMNY